MKLPEIPLPEPVLLMIEVTRGSDRDRRVMVAALRFLLWMVPSAVTGYVLAATDGGRHSLWMTLAASFAVLATAVLLVNARDAGGEDAA